MRPTEYTTAAVCMLVSGLFNVVFGILIFSVLVWFCIGFFWLLPAAWGLVQIALAVRMLNGDRVHAAMPFASLSTLISLVNLNLLGFTCDIVVIFLMRDRQVTAWLEADDMPSETGW